VVQLLERSAYDFFINKALLIFRPKRKAR
jgi:hypothetical protein